MAIRLDIWERKNISNTSIKQSHQMKERIKDCRSAEGILHESLTGLDHEELRQPTLKDELPEANK